jgi:hypothetical protein
VWESLFPGLRTLSGMGSLIDSAKAIVGVGLRPSFSAHVRCCERGAPVRFPPPLCAKSLCFIKMIKFHFFPPLLLGRGLGERCAKSAISHRVNREWLEQ